MKHDASQPPSVRNHTAFRIENHPVDDVLQADPSGIEAFDSEAPELLPASAAHAVTPVVSDQRPRVAAPLTRGLAALALVIAGLLIGRSNVFETRVGRLVIESEPSAADVWLDGRHLGTTPLSLMSDAGRRSLRIDADGASRTMTVELTNGQVTHARVDFVRVPMVAAAPPIPATAPAIPLTPAPQVTAQDDAPPAVRLAATERTREPGWIDVPAVAALDVYEGDRHLGNTADGRIRLPAGAHALEFVNEELGVRVRVHAIVHPGKVTSVTVRKPDLGELRTQARVAADTADTAMPASRELTE